MSTRRTMPGGWVPRKRGPCRWCGGGLYRRPGGVRASEPGRRRACEEESGGHAAIRKGRKAYYDILERTQRDTMDVTNWMEWFLACLGRAVDGSDQALDTVLGKARFWERIQTLPLNERQRTVLNQLLDGFEGKLSSSKYAIIAKCSQDSADRDILALVEQGILVRNPGGGCSTSYSLAE